STLTVLTSSGFDPWRAPSPSGTLPPPENPRLSANGMSGELVLRFKRVKNASNYTVQTSENSDGPWLAGEVSNTCTVTIADLTPGQVCWVRVCANGAAGQSPWAGPVGSMVM